MIFGISLKSIDSTGQKPCLDETVYLFFIHYIYPLIFFLNLISVLDCNFLLLMQRSGEYTEGAIELTQVFGCVICLIPPFYIYF